MSILLQCCVDVEQCSCERMKEVVGYPKVLYLSSAVSYGRRSGSVEPVRGRCLVNVREIQITHGRYRDKMPASDMICACVPAGQALVRPNGRRRTAVDGF